ncbi:MAG: YbaY family lipoprotein [Rhizobiales bacterium]|nr:YbaY family lipoprotein [Hyphomicrobiales bacterium]
MIIDRFAELLVFGFMPLMIGTMALPLCGNAQAQAVAGEMYYRERIALPPEAEAILILAEADDSGAPGRTIATRAVKRLGQVPIRFSMDVEPGAVAEQRRYVLVAHIRVAGHAWFTGEARDLDAASLSSIRLLLERSS